MTATTVAPRRNITDGPLIGSIPVILLWLATSAILLWLSRDHIATIGFRDPDDAMRMKQVLDLIGGQSWWDLRQYAVDPPHGTDMHWSRLVDLPILMILRPAMAILGRDDGIRVAAAVEPLLPLLPAMLAIAHAVRRLVDPRAAMLGAFCLVISMAPMGMMAPMRVDHHGWQIALSCIVLASLVGDISWRSGLAAGIATAISLNIGMETAAILVVAAAVVVGRWIQTGERNEIRAYALPILVLLPVGYETLQPWGNARPLCDALTPVWTTDGALGAALILAATLINGRIGHRLAAVGATVAAICLWHALRWPGCALPIDNVGPQAQALWVSHNQETKPITALAGAILATLTPPVAISMLVFNDALRSDERARWIAPAAMFAASLAIAIWRIRGIPLLQTTTVPPVTFLSWRIMESIGSTPMKRMAARASIPIVATGAILPLLSFVLNCITPETAPDPFAVCRQGTRIERLDAVQGGIALADINMSPYIPLFTRHRTLAGPYHRDDAAIVDLIRDWRESPERAHADVVAHRIDLIVDCQGEGIVGTPDSFRSRLEQGLVPWAKPVDVPGLAPIRVWRVARD